VIPDLPALAGILALKGWEAVGQLNGFRKRPYKADRKKHCPETS